MKQKLAPLFLALLCCSGSFGQIKLEDLRVDTAITGFRFAADLQGTLLFTKNGAADLNTVNPSGYSFTIVPGATAQTALDQLQQLRNVTIEDGYPISDLVQKDTVLSGFPAYYTSYTETDKDSKDYKNLVFNAFVVKDATLILFVSGDLHYGKYTDKFKRTFYSIKL